MRDTRRKQPQRRKPLRLVHLPLQLQPPLHQTRIFNRQCNLIAKRTQQIPFFRRKRSPAFLLTQTQQPNRILLLQHRNTQFNPLLCKYCSKCRMVQIAHIQRTTMGQQPTDHRFNLRPVLVSKRCNRRLKPRQTTACDHLHLTHPPLLVLEHHQRNSMHLQYSSDRIHHRLQPPLQRVRHIQRLTQCSQQMLVFVSRPEKQAIDYPLQPILNRLKQKNQQRNQNSLNHLYPEPTIQTPKRLCNAPDHQQINRQHNTRQRRIKQRGIHHNLKKAVPINKIAQNIRRRDRRKKKHQREHRSHNITLKQPNRIRKNRQNRDNSQREGHQPIKHLMHLCL